MSGVTGLRNSPRQPWLSKYNQLCILSFKIMCVRKQKLGIRKIDKNIRRYIFFPRPGDFSILEMIVIKDIVMVVYLQKFKGYRVIF